MTSQRNCGAAADTAEASNAPATLTAHTVSRPKYLKGECARVSRTGRTGVSQRDLAAVLDLHPGEVAKMELGDEPRSWSVLHVAAAPPEARSWAEAMVRWQAAKHELQVLRATDIVHGDNHAARLASVVSELTDVLRVFSAALADGHLSDAELETIASESREAMHALLEVDRFVTVELAKRGGGR